MDNWRLIDTGLLSGVENITLDSVILDAKAQGLIPNTFRFLRFNPPVALAGFHQSIDQEIRVDYCNKNNIDINRRITGGGAIYFSPEQLGWEIYADIEKERFPADVDKLYEKICKAAAKGLSELGIKANFRPKNDIEVNHRKISGTGGMSKGNSFMFQGTLLIDVDLNKMLRSLRIPVKKLSDKEIDSVRDRVTTIKNELGFIPSLEQIKNKILSGFKKEFNINFIQGELTDFEKNEFKKELNYFKSYEWVYGIRENKITANTLFNLKKTKGGLIKLSLAIDTELGLINSSFITGDFFAYPPGIIYNLETLMKHIKIDKLEIDKILTTFFKENKFQIPGVTLNDFIVLFSEAIDKFTNIKYGLNLDEINNLYFVNRNLDYFKENGCDTLLLPYCSKFLDCAFRYSEGCTFCGLCTIGDGYNFANKYGLKPITITSYEHLEEILSLLDKQKSVGYIGCCCEAFYSKHQMDFESFKTPGILINIDSDTCYDLGLEKEAHEGRFEHQTNININLLEKIILIIKKIS